MSTPGRVIHHVSTALGIPEPTVGVYQRHLREAGLVSRVGRGRYAGHSTPLDIGRLILSLLATETAVKAPDAVGDFGSLLCDRIDIGEEKLTLEMLCGPSFGKGHRFEDAVAAIVAGFGHDDFMGVMDEHLITGVGHHGPYLPPVIVRVRESHLDASINIAGTIYLYEHPIQIERDHTPWYVGDPAAPNPKHIALGLQYDEINKKWFRGIRVQREISGVEIQNLNELMRDDAPE